MPSSLGLNDVKILSVLLSQEMYGLEIRDAIKEEENTNFSIGSLYVTLNRLEKNGFVKS